jgi:hypothetical protein
MPRASFVQVNAKRCSVTSKTISFGVTTGPGRPTADLVEFHHAHKIIRRKDILFAPDQIKAKSGAFVAPF